MIFNSINPGRLAQVGSNITQNPGPPNGLFFPNGTPRTYVDAAIGDFDTSAQGNELLLGTEQLNPDGSRVATLCKRQAQSGRFKALAGRTPRPAIIR